ncbi:NUDIX domain-containing protein [Candidatus Micrarchaeota archaeon]|nr:NUDIX domain-containing protein [Candidatus Micrarchaeota archaeon]
MRKKVKHGVEAVLFRRKPLRFLVLHSRKQWKGWEFVKGGRNKKETELASLRREVREETGLRSFRLLCRLPVVSEFEWDEKTKRAAFNRERYTYSSIVSYLAEASAGRVRLDPLEHDAYKWVSAEQALKMLRWPGPKRALRAALSVLRAGG